MTMFSYKRYLVFCSLYGIILM